MKKLELTKDELEKLYHLPPKDVEKETEFQITYRMGRNSLVLELIKKINEELTPYIEYYDNGNVAVKGQKNSVGQEEGIWEFFYSNGNILYSNGNIQCRTPYKEGKADGIQEIFYPNGNIQIRTPYKDGKMNGIEERFFENGNIQCRTPFKDGKEDGIEERFFENGNIRRRTPFKEGKEDGIEERFFENGNIRRRTPFKEGKKDGIEEWFCANGNITKTRLWKDGKLIEETKPKPQPDPQLIDFMAMRYRHDFGFLDEKHKESIRTTMKQLWEEVVGLGFYKPKSK
jgi:antitoxin component YwqK of YwqJK toxin-antitoxin module